MDFWGRVTSIDYVDVATDTAVSLAFPIFGTIYGFGATADNAIQNSEPAPSSSQPKPSALANWLGYGGDESTFDKIRSTVRWMVILAGICLAAYLMVLVF